MNIENEFVTPNELASKIGKSVVSVYKWIELGSIESTEFVGLKCFTKEQAEIIIKKHK